MARITQEVQGILEGHQIYALEHFVPCVIPPQVFETCQVYDPHALLRFLTSATVIAAREASAASHSHGARSSSLFTGTM